MSDIRSLSMTEIMEHLFISERERNLKENSMKPSRSIIAVGGGKGGVGKSVIATNLAVLLARKDKKTILVDMDFGSANLHTCLGEKAPASSIKDFLLKKKSTLSEILIDTQIENLQFISGAGDMPGLANMKHTQKRKIIKHLRMLDAEFIVLDLAPGITFNVLDFFSVADKAILVTTPETTSITNAFSFIKAFLFRELHKAFKGNTDVLRLFDSARDPTNAQGIRTLAELNSRIEKIDGEGARKFRYVCESFKPMFLLNMVKYEEDLSMGRMLVSLIDQYVNVKCECLGYLKYDDAVPDSIAEMRPFVLEYPESDAAASLEEISSRISGSLPEYVFPTLTEEMEEPEPEPAQSSDEPFQSAGTVRRWENHVSSERPHIQNGTTSEDEQELRI